MDEKRKAFEAALAACKTALDVCDDVISISFMRGYVADDNFQVHITVDKDPDGLLKDVEPTEAEGFYLRLKVIGDFRVSSCNSRRAEEAYRERHGLPPLPLLEVQRNNAEEG